MSKPINTLSYDHQTAEHASASVAVEWQLIEDATRLGGVASKEFRAAFLVGSIAGIKKVTLNDGAAILAKKAPLVRRKQDDDKAWAERQKTRRAEIKAGTVIERNKDEQNVYSAAGMRLSRFCKTHSIAPASKDRGTKTGDKEKTEAGKDATPKANNAANADKFMRQQCAMMLAYVEKNKPMIPAAMFHAVMELKEAFDAVPENA